MVRWNKSVCKCVFTDNIVVLMFFVDSYFHCSTSTEKTAGALYSVNNWKCKSIACVALSQKASVPVNAQELLCSGMLCKVHSRFHQVCRLRVVRVHDPVIPPLALGSAQPHYIFTNCSWLTFFSSSQFPPVCQYKLRAFADAPIIAVKMIYLMHYIQRVSYRITCKESAHAACQ